MSRGTGRNHLRYFHAGSLAKLAKGLCQTRRNLILPGVLAAVIIVLALAPTLQSAEPKPTEEELRIEILQHLEFPCAANLMISSVKRIYQAEAMREQITTRKNLRDLLPIMLTASLAAVRKADYAMIPTVEDLEGMTREERHGLYRRCLAPCVSQVIGLGFFEAGKL